MTAECASEDELVFTGFTTPAPRQEPTLAIVLFAGRTSEVGLKGCLSDEAVRTRSADALYNPRVCKKRILLHGK